MREMRVDILLCTFRRASVVATLESLAQQACPPGLCLRVIIADNDDTPSAAPLIRGMRMPFPVVYLHAPARNISLARNAALAASDADWLAFLDDDEIAPEGWLAALWAEAGGADAVFGPAEALYPAGTPDWMRRGDYHSNRPVLAGGEIRTGHTCNALLRWNGTPWQDLRFDLARGQTGGEDTEFFHNIRRRGARFALAPEAFVSEPVAPARLSTRWLLRRRYRMGLSHVSAAEGAGGRARLAATATAKAGACAAMMLANLWHSARARFWLLRGALHFGVVAGVLGLRAPRIYGG